MTNILTIDEKGSFTCISCGPRPKVLVIDGIAMGLQVKELEKNKEAMKINLPYESKEVLEGSNFVDRMFIKKSSNRKILREAVEKKEWPILKETEIESDPEFEIGEKRKRAEKDSGMEMFQKMLSKIDKSNPPSNGLLLLMQELSANTSTTSLIQVVDKPLLTLVMRFLRGEQKYNFIIGTTNIALHEQLRSEYPVLIQIIRSLANEEGMIEKSLRNFLLALLQHILAQYDSAPAHLDTLYNPRVEGEVDTQVFPNFPILKERAIYEKTCKNQDAKAQKELCEKDFPTHSKLTPGLYLMTCGCKNKVVYGFSMMMSGESPQMLFDIVMTRFENEYNPHIIYDASCKVKEFGLNREQRRFMQLKITTDCFHEQNHKTCSSAFKSSLYDTLRKVNTEACEQTNSVLRSVTASTTFMKPLFYMRSLTLFIANLNIIANMKTR